MFRFHDKMFRRVIVAILLLFVFSFLDLGPGNTWKLPTMGACGVVFLFWGTHFNYAGSLIWRRTHLFVPKPVLSASLRVGHNRGRTVVSVPRCCVLVGVPYVFWYHSFCGFEDRTPFSAFPKKQRQPQMQFSNCGGDTVDGQTATLGRWLIPVFMSLIHPS